MDLNESTISTPDNLIAGASDVIAIPITVASGQGELPRGQLLGKLTAGGFYAKCDSATNPQDGSEVGDVILCDNIDATDEDIVTTGYTIGEFNENAVVFGGTDTADTHRESLRAKGIILRPSVEP